MKKFLQHIKLAFLLLCFAGTTALAHDTKKTTVVPESEKAKAQQLLADGPKKTSGVAGVDILGTVSLNGEFNSSDGLELRARELVIEVGGIVAVHQHEHRPGVAYILEGEMTEYRSSAPGPILKKTGDVAFERSGVIHWWKNTGTTPARALVVDIVKAK